ncbi:MAG TPA: hypothetical protein VGM05_34615 [Planctomycetaceae bacterium]
MPQTVEIGEQPDIIDVGHSSRFQIGLQHLRRVIRQVGPQGRIRCHFSGLEPLPEFGDQFPTNRQ